MRKLKILSVLMLFLVSVLSLSANAVDLGSVIQIQEVRVDGTDLAPIPTVNWLDLERDQEIDVRIELFAYGVGEDGLEDIEITAFISGYEYSDHEAMSDSTHVFDMEEDVTYVKRLRLRLPSRVEEDKYLLRLIISDRTNEAITEEYQLKIDVPRHALEIRDVVFSPGYSVQAGRALLTTVRVKNVGEKDEDGVKVSVRIPALGISASDYIDEIEADDSTTSEELYIRIPPCAGAGDYTVVVDVEFDEGFEEVSTSEVITVTRGDACTLPGDVDDSGKDKVLITLSTDSQDVVQGEGGAVFPLTITNEGSSRRTFVISVEGTEDWASTRVSPSNVVVVDGGETQTAFVYVSAASDAPLGRRIFSVTISSGSEELEQIPLEANVVSGGLNLGWSQVRKALEVGFVILVVILVVLGLIIGFSKLREKDEPDDISGQTYY